MSWGPFRLKMTKADKLFSLVVRFRDNWECQFCHWQANEENAEDRYRIDCSHFFQRSIRSTRFDPENAVAACKRCHTNLKGPTDPFYQNFMEKRIGRKAFDLLWLRGHTPAKVDEAGIVLWCQAELKKMGVDPKTGKRLKLVLK